MTYEKRFELYARARRVFGDDNQIRKAQTECNELGAEIGKLFEGRATLADDVASELADVIILCEQLREIIGADAVDRWIDRKLAKLDAAVLAREPLGQVT